MMSMAEAIKRRNASPEHKQRVIDHREEMKRRGLVTVQVWTTPDIRSEITRIAQRHRDGELTEERILEVFKSL
jgi:hypothetical protein